MLKVAILEDSEVLLKDLKEMLEDTGLVEVVAYATSSGEFMDKVERTHPEALFLDIDLGGDSMNGLDLANRLKLPVIFVSGHTQTFNNRIEELNINLPIPVHQITKPITAEKLNKILNKFILDINAYNRTRYVHLDFEESKKNRISIDRIVYLETETGISGTSNNKKIYFSDRKPEKLFNFSFNKMEEMGFDASIFITIHKSYRVNVDRILKYINSSHEIVVEVLDPNGKRVTKNLPVSENYRKYVKKI